MGRRAGRGDDPENGSYCYYFPDGHGTPRAIRDQNKTRLAAGVAEEHREAHVPTDDRAYR